MNQAVKDKLAKQARSLSQPKLVDDSQPVTFEYDPPAAIPGWPVLWHDDRQKSHSYWAFVVSTAGETVDLLAMIPDSPVLDPRKGVRHIGDPNKMLIDGAGEGCWEHAPQTERLLFALDDIERLRQDNDLLMDTVENLSKQVTELQTQIKKTAP